MAINRIRQNRYNFLLLEIFTSDLKIIIIIEIKKIIFEQFLIFKNFFSLDTKSFSLIRRRICKSCLLLISVLQSRAVVFEFLIL